MDAELLTKGLDEFLTFKAQNVQFHGQMNGFGRVYLLGPSLANEANVQCEILLRVRPLTLRIIP